MTRDLTKEQFSAAMKRHGFTPQGFMGYWQGPSGMSQSSWNYGTRREALAGMIREDKRWAEKKAAKAARN